MKTALIATMALFLVACAPMAFSGTAKASDAPPCSQSLIGTQSIIHLDGYQSLTTGIVVSQDGSGVVVRLDSTGKLYFYPQARLSGIEQL